MSLAVQSQKWFPTHVQVTVLQAAELQAKGKNGTNDAYTIIQLGKEKYSTSVAEKTLNPMWREEASFELPGLLVEGNPEVYELCLVVMHRSLVGMDKFLGQKSVNLNEVFDNKERKKINWYTLDSRLGKKKKERGKIQVSIQFVRNNMTASMFDLSMRDKPRSPFSKLKDKVKGRKHDSDASSAILPRSAQCDAESQLPQNESDPKRQLKTANLEPKPKHSLLPGAQKLSAAHSMSDLVGTHFRPKTDSVNSMDESDGVNPHRRSQSEMPGYQDGEMAGDPFPEMPQKSATLPRNRNPFESDHGQLWDKKEKKEKVSLLERVTGKKEGKKTSNGGRAGNSGDLHHFTNPFTTESDTNPFLPHHMPSNHAKKPGSNEDLSKKNVSPEKKQGKKIVRETEAEKLQSSMAAYSNLSFEEVVQELVKQKEVVKKKDAHIRELEDYIDNLLVRVMEETPSILRTPYEPKRKAGKITKK
ncbi:rab11 family-interacting protein 2 [Tachysurus fulvidraco]|uniref:rab11 family-interacting protein 2 n=1 Tax=Tachysurus fulvidraco TaxID=1234273 RepID=UPI000F4F8C51|nr:rab11 family-interacting protein 2 [Tachysurus fulvidraco]XP_027021664.1 rab11 family-interacting protein 2 [Tachysurus fulvidraco]XP_027021665.1 rab11 family-interacting protein 2 [Tachysurus fulvidraco]